VTGKQSKGRTKFGATNFWILIASSFYWAWFDVATFRPTLFLAFDNASDFFSMYFSITMISGAVFLFIAASKSDKVAPFIKMVPSGIIAVALAVGGTLLTMLGAFLLNPLPIMVGAILTGSACSFFLLEWARMYSRQGARSASLLISSSIALGTLIDLLVIGLAPLFAAFFTVLLPIIALGILFNIYWLISQEEEVSRQAADNQDSLVASEGSTITMDMIFPNSKRRPFSFSLSLVMAFFIFGLSFGFMQFNTAFSVTDLYPLSSDALLVSRGVTALTIFLAIFFFPNKLYTTFRIGILIGIAGFIAVPFLSEFANSSLISGFVIAVGYTTFDIITWVVLAEIVFSTKQNATHAFGTGRFFVHSGLAVGFLLASAFAFFPVFVELRTALTVTIGYFVVIAEMLLLNENSALWLLIRFNKNPQAQEGESGLAATLGAPAIDFENYSHWIESFNLTEREAEILRYMLMGRSTSRMAQILMISDNTVNSHIQHIYRKLDIHNRQELLDRFT
jgi:DNA-binding CsgD family transcriptional regulator